MNNRLPQRMDVHQIKTLVATMRGEAPRPFVVGIGGMPGAGKTTLAKLLTQAFAPQALHVSEDDFLAISTETRRSFLRDALARQDEAKLDALASPADQKDNPYANPGTWYDWDDLRRCLQTVISGRDFTRHGGWNQQTGACDRDIHYAPFPDVPVLCFVDANNPLRYADLIDRLIVIEVDPAILEARQRKRDAHRSDPAYLAYKKRVDELYVAPVFAKVRARADVLVTLDRMDVV